MRISEGAQERLIAAARDTEPVHGLTHGFYKYPARFSPSFARATIEIFTKKLPRRSPPQFMGMSREAWMIAQPELLEHFGLTKVVEVAGRIMHLDLHSNYAATGRRNRTTKKHVATFGR